MTLHYISFAEPPGHPLFDQIKDRDKTVDGRKYSKKYQKIKTNDSLIFHLPGKGFLKCLVTFVHKYKTLEDYLLCEGIKTTLPSAASEEEALTLYNQFSSPEKREDLRAEFGFGFVAFGLHLTDYLLPLNHQEHQKEQD